MKVSDCDCVILCGGRGERLKSVVSDMPKVMAEVEGQPFLDYVIEFLISQKIERIVLCTGYKADMIEEYYRENDFGISIECSNETEPLGTGGAIKNAKDKISSDPFFVFNGDSLISADLQPFLDFHIQKKCIASILVTEMSERSDFGSLTLNQDGKIYGFHEKMESEHNQFVNAGIYCFYKDLFSYMPGNKAFSLEKDVFPRLVQQQFYGYRTDKDFIDIGTPQRYESVKKMMKHGKVKKDG